MIYSLCSGGAEKIVVDLSNELALMGHEVILLMLLSEENNKYLFNKQFLDSKVKFCSLNFTRGFSLSKVKKVENFILKENPDIVHCHLNVIPYIFRLALINKKIRFFHTLHNVAEATCGSYIQSKINRLFYKRSIIHPVCISSLCLESYISFYKLHNASYVNNGRAIVKPTKLLNDVRQEIEGYKQDNDTIVFIHVARCDRQKNQKLLIEAFNRLDKSSLDFVLLIIGNGFDSEMGEQLKLTACSKIFFLGEKINVTDYLLSSDAFCLSSHYEGLPISLLEAISCGITPICTAVGGIPNVIADGKYGYLAKDQNVETYVEAVMRFVKQPLDKNTLIEYFMNNFSIKKCASEYVEIYRKN